MPRVSARGWFVLACWTLLGTLGCIVVALAINYFFFRGLRPAAFERSMLSAIVIPILLAGPLVFYLTLKLRELARAERRLEAMAATDGLTSALNRRAFTSRVEEWMGEAAEPEDEAKGALLVIDADHFKKINDTFGHECGDEALKVMARSIRSVLRGTDLFGRMGGEEFGVFLPGASDEDAMEIAERVRQAVYDASFDAGDTPHRLSVSVGAAAFDYPLGFTELFRIADDRLYEAKRAGRNRVVLVNVTAQEALAERPFRLH